MQKLDDELKRDIMRKIAMDENEKIEIKMSVPEPCTDRDFLEASIDNFTNPEAIKNLSKKEKAYLKIDELALIWCHHKIVDGGCDGCPLDDGGRLNSCLLQHLKQYINANYDDGLIFKRTVEDCDERL